MEPVVSLLQNLVRIPSVNPADVTDTSNIDWTIYGEKRIADWLATYLTDNDFLVELTEVKPGRPNLTAWSRAPKDGEAAICLCSHLDVVPVGGMTIPPFDAEISNGMMWGRGTSDPKGSVAAMTIAAIKEARNPQTPPVLLLFNMDEEAGFSGARHFVNSYDASLLGAVIGEPTGLNMLTGHKGIFRSYLTVTGEAAHASMPELGTNAIYRMARILERLERYASDLRSRPPHSLLGNASCNVGVIEGGVAFNSVPDRCSISIDRRTLPDETSDQIRAEILAIVSDLHFAGDIDLAEPKLFAPGFETPQGDWLQRTTSAFDQKPGRAAPYATDGAVLQRAGIDCVIYGPGEMETAHTRDEHVPVDQVVEAVEGYRKVIRG